MIRNEYMIFERIISENDYESIASGILYSENNDKLSDYTEGEFVEMDVSTKQKIFDELGLNFKFVLTFGTSITAFYPIVENFIKNSEFGTPDKSTVIYLTICALSIVLNQPKDSYRKLFTELRMRNVYGLLVDITKFIKMFFNMFKFTSKLVGRVVSDLVGMFSYTSLFVPFALTLSQIILLEKIEVSEIIGCFVEDGVLKLTSTLIGVSMLSIREIIKKLIYDMSTFTFSKFKKHLSKSFSKVYQSVINLVKSFSKVKIEDVDNRLEQITIDLDHVNVDVLKYSQWLKSNNLPKGVERIDEFNL